ncbi:MAG: hypothetical protein ABI831_10355 [Betaproteobacteria bacterium]
MPSSSELFGALLFGTIGMAAIIYGRKSAQWKPMLVGVALVAFPYFVAQTWQLYAIGGALCVALFLFRD